MAWNMAREFLSPKNIISGSQKPYFVLKAALCSSPSLMQTLSYPCLTSNVEHISASLTCAIKFGMRGRGYQFGIPFLAYLSRTFPEPYLPLVS
jgi:hypothetical protein